MYSAEKHCKLQKWKDNLFLKKHSVTYKIMIFQTSTFLEFKTEICQ